MKCMRHILLYVGLWMLPLLPAAAQNEATLYFMNSLPQVTYLNPASVPRYKFSVGLPGSSIMALYGNNGFTYNDFAEKEGGVVKANLNKLYNAMADKNYISLATKADLFRLSLKVNPRIYLTLNTTITAYNSIMLPKEVAGIFINGTVAYVNSVASLAPNVESLVYVETGVGTSYVVNKDLTLGLRVKILKGATNITTERAQVDLSLDNSYAITVRADADIKTSGLQNLIDPNDDQPGEWQDYLENNWEEYLKNSGFAFDIGATYKVTEKFTVGLSLIDIGSIKWNNDRYGYNLDPARANYTFRGFDLERILDGDDDYIDAEIDSIENRFVLREGRVQPYSTMLPAKAYLSGAYELKRNFKAGLLLFAERFNQRTSTGASVSLNKDFGRRFSTSLSYTATSRSFNNIGMGLSLNFAPFQLYVVGDNILRAPLALMTDGNLNPFVNTMHYFNVRAGLNIVFGWDKVQEKQPYPLKTRL